MSFNNHKAQSPWLQKKPNHPVRYRTNTCTNIFFFNSGNRNRDPRTSISTPLYSSTLLLLKVCDGCQLDLVWNQLRDIPPVGGSVMVFPGRIKWRRHISSEISYIRRSDGQVDAFAYLPSLLVHECIYSIAAAMVTFC